MYSLIHFYTSRMVRTRPDIPMKIIAAILCHKDTRIIDKLYGHLRISDIVRIMERSENTRQEIVKRIEKDKLKLKK